MNYKKVSVLLVVVVVFLLGLIIIQNNRYTEMENAHKHNYGQQSFGIMMHVAGKLKEITIKYESQELTTDDLNEYYDSMDEFILSVYNQQPIEFMMNIRELRFTERYDALSFNDEVNEAYNELAEFLFSTYKEVEENYEDDEFIDFYNVYTDEEFNETLSQLIQNLNSSK